MTQDHCPRCQFPLFTPREREIVRLVSCGHTNAEIGKALYLSEKTVKNYLWIIFQKAQVHTRVELAIQGFIHGYAPAPERHAPWHVPDTSAQDRRDAKVRRARRRVRPIGTALEAMP